MDEERAVRKRGLPEENTDESTSSGTKRILLLADKSREQWWLKHHQMSKA